MDKNIILIGMPGCGKTTIGSILAKQLKIEFIDMDEYIQNTTSKTVGELFETGEEHFRDIETKACIELAKKKNILISTGGGVVKRSENIGILKKDSIIIFIDRPVEKILKDVDVSKRPLLKDGKEKIINLYKERYELYKKAADKVVLNDKNINEVIEKLHELL
ncbi:shikimate kinase [Clostridium butyricum]|uniref:shikimate kinase n=1 Tax=Clostridium butyricum TaxID=1492 RepID=UPI00290E7209|nr:shikimate kinase [Clostridium butyricum]MDU5821381.1 shikimate kinase [Clostridium butyricum]